MELVSLQQVNPGAVLAAPVTNRDGAVLCPKGFHLTEAALARIARAGIQAVIIEGAGKHEPNYKRRLEQLEARFSGVEDPLLLQLKATMARILRNLDAPDAGAE